ASRCHTAATSRGRPSLRGCPIGGKKLVSGRGRGEHALPRAEVFQIVTLRSGYDTHCSGVFPRSLVRLRPRGVPPCQSPTNSSGVPTWVGTPIPRPTPPPSRTLWSSATTAPP